jgi:hypothetical protein
MRKHYPAKALKASNLDRQTLFIEEHDAVSGLNGTNHSIESTQRPISASSHSDTRLSASTAITHTIRNETRVPVLLGDPWDDYESRYGLKHWCLIKSAISRATGQLALIRTIECPLPEETIHLLCTVTHPNIVQTKEIYSSSTTVSIVSEFLPTSLQQLCRIKMYPSEAELASIVYQVREWDHGSTQFQLLNKTQILSGTQYLQDNGLVHETLSCDSVLLSQNGQVKIGNIESCKHRGDPRLFGESFSKIMMMLMYKSSLAQDESQRWSAEAVEFFRLCCTQPTMLGSLLSHGFLGKRNEKPLALLVNLTLMSARHDKFYFDKI